MPANTKWRMKSQNLSTPIEISPLMITGNKIAKYFEMNEVMEDR